MTYLQGPRAKPRTDFLAQDGDQSNISLKTIARLHRVLCSISYMKDIEDP